MGQCMITDVNENLLEFPLDGFMHSCNCFHTFGAGIALSVRQKYPEAFDADRKHGRRGDMSRLGKFSYVKAHDDKYIYNIYGQYNFGTWSRMTNYEAMYNGMFLVKEHAINNNVNRIGLPNNMGCKLGGGDFRIIRTMIEVIFEEYNGEVFICNYNGG